MAHKSWPKIERGILIPLFGVTLVLFVVRGRAIFRGTFFKPLLARDTSSESLSDFLQKSQMPVEALWSLRSIDLRVIALSPSFCEIAHAPKRFGRPIDRRANQS